MYKKALYVGNLNFSNGFASIMRVLNISKLLFLSFQIETNIFLDCYNNELDNDDFCLQHKIIFHKKNKIEKFQSYYSATEYLNFLKGNKVDLIILYDCPFFVGLKILKFARKHKIKVVGDITEWFDGRGYPFPLNIIKWMDSNLRMRFLNKKVDGLILISDLLYSSYKINKIKIYPLMDFCIYKALKLGFKRVPHSSINYCYCGSTMTGKDEVKTIIDNFLKHNNRNSKLYLIGKFDIDKEQYIKDDYFASNVVFKNYVPYDKLLKMYSVMDYQIVIRKKTRSNNAGFPTKIAEALSLGLGVISNCFSDLKLVSKHCDNLIIFERIDEIFKENKEIKNLTNSDIFLSEKYINDFKEFLLKI